MPQPNQPWTTSYPAEQDTVGEEQPDLTNDSYPGRRDGDRVLVEHVHALRDKLQALALKVGDDNGLPLGSLRSMYAVYTDSNRPSAGEFPIGSAIWNISDKAPNWSDGVYWRDAMGNIT